MLFFYTRLFRTKWIFSKHDEKFRKQKKSATAAILPAESANGMQSGACFAVPLRKELKEKKIKKRQHLKIILPSAILVLIKAYPQYTTIPNSALSNLVRQNLSELVI